MAITLTESAAERVRNCLAERGSGVGLRLGITKTGCSGFAYVVNYADSIEPEDTVFDAAGRRRYCRPVCSRNDRWHRNRLRKTGPERSLLSFVTPNPPANAVAVKVSAFNVAVFTKHYFIHYLFKIFSR